MKLKIHTQILIAIISGVAAGLLLGEKAKHVKIVGDLFIRLLRMIIIPLIMASMVAGVVSIGNIRNLGKIGLRTFVYYMATTLLAVGVGLILVNVLKPGAGVELGMETNVEAVTPSVVSIVTDIVPKNLFKSMAEDKVLSIIFFSLLLGVALSSVGEKAKPLVTLFEALNAVMLRITDWIMRLAPLGVFALMACTIGQMGLAVIKPLAVYMATVVLGLGIHAFITLPILLSVFGRYSPARFIKDMFSAVATAFSTASSAATLPITMDCLEKKT
ncbi:MAG TPA: dicarboxylate/amino acid:cation symporter, partial [Phycisphaerales bacterium]|nr:dicarboxylate/amino acid:cation symporter [Phycisphaerales bacterium]